MDVPYFSDRKFHPIFQSKNKKEPDFNLTPSFSIVGVAGFEPATPCSQSRCASRTALYPVNYFNISNSGNTSGVANRDSPGSNRDAPAELRSRKYFNTKQAVRAGFEPAVQYYPYAGLANRWFQPLTHLTFDFKTNYICWFRCHNIVVNC